MGEISAASEEQSSGIEQVNRAVTQMDDVTQQNAALVEQAAAAAASLEEQTRQLKQVVAVWRVDAAARAAAAHEAAMPRSPTAHEGAMPRSPTAVAKASRPAIKPSHAVDKPLPAKPAAPAAVAAATVAAAASAAKAATPATHAPIQHAAARMKPGADANVAGPAATQPPVQPKPVAQPTPRAQKALVSAGSDDDWETF
jgi:hypothetical protein